MPPTPSSCARPPGDPPRFTSDIVRRPRALITHKPFRTTFRRRTASMKPLRMSARATPASEGKRWPSDSRSSCTPLSDPDRPTDENTGPKGGPRSSET